MEEDYENVNGGMQMAKKKYILQLDKHPEANQDHQWITL